MYDFYANPPKTKQEIREWLKSWLQETGAESPIVEKTGERFIQTHGFSRAFYLHTVFRNIDTNEFVWWVYSKDDNFSMDSFPEERYNSFDDMLTAITNDYYILWNK